MGEHVGVSGVGVIRGLYAVCGGGNRPPLIAPGALANGLDLPFAQRRVTAGLVGLCQGGGDLCHGQPLRPERGGKMEHFLVSPPLCDFAGDLLALCLFGLFLLALEHKTVEPVGERCQRYACRRTAGLPLIGPPGRGMDGRRRNHIAACPSIVQAGGKAHRHGQGRVVTLEVVVNASTAGQTSPGFWEGAILPFQVCKGFVPKLPRIVGGVHIQHHQTVSGGDSDVVCTASAPPLRDLCVVRGGILASVRGGWCLTITWKYRQAHIFGVIFSMTL